MPMLYGVSSVFFFLPLSWLASPSGPSPSHRESFEITHRHTTFGRTPLDDDNTHKKRDIHAPIGIRTRNRSKRGAADTAPGIHNQEVYH